MFYILLKFPDGTENLLDNEKFDTYDKAVDMAIFYCSCYKQGAKKLNMSNSCDYSVEDDECEYEIIEK